MSGEAFKRQLELGYSAYNLIYPDLGFIGFVGLHHANSDGQSGRFYWMFMQPDSENIVNADHWLQASSQQERLDHVKKTAAPLPAKLREIFELTPAEGMRKDMHIWRDLELDSLPSSRVTLLGDAAHAMTPSRGEGAFHAFVDAMKLSKTLAQLEVDAKFRDIEAVKTGIAEYHNEMLARGTNAVRASRNAYQEAKKRIDSGEPFTAGTRPLVVKSVTLPTKVSSP